MNRHLALTFAGATAIFVTAASGAFAANVGLLNVGPAKPVGQLSAANVAQLATPTAARSDITASETGTTAVTGAADSMTVVGPSNAAGSQIAGSAPSSSGGSSSSAVSLSGAGAATSQLDSPPAPSTPLPSGPPTTSQSQVDDDDYEDQDDDDYDDEDQDDDEDEDEDDDD